MVSGEIPGITPEEGYFEDPNLTLSQPWNLTLSDTQGHQEQLNPTAKFISEVKAEARSQVLSQANQNILQHVQTLIKQGSFLELCKLEQTWNSYINNLPKGNMKFTWNASIDTLPTKTNLKQWQWGI